MKKINILLIFAVILNISLVRSESSLDFKENLQAQYPFQRNLREYRNNFPDAVNFENGQIQVEDRFSIEESAYQFQDGQTGIFIIPIESVQNLVDFSFTIWVKNLGNSQAQLGEETLLQLQNENQVQYIVLKNRKLILSSTMNQWVPAVFEFSENLLFGENGQQWQQIGLIRKSEENVMEVYRNGVLFFSVGIQDVFDQFEVLEINRFILGNYQENQQEEYTISNQFVGAVNDLRIYDALLEPGKIGFLYQYELNNPFKDHQKCIDYLQNLGKDVIQIDLTLPLIDDQYYHNYNINFGDFTYEKHCFQSELVLGFKELSMDIQDNQFNIQFPLSEGSAWGCSQLSVNQQQCLFQLEIFYQNVLQHKNVFLAIVTTPDLQNYEVRFNNGFELENDVGMVDQIIDHHSFDQTIECQIKFCIDIQCSQYIDDPVFIRNADIFMEYKILTPGYNRYNIQHNFLQLKNFSPEILNLEHINTLQLYDNIVYHFRAPQAGQQITLVVSISLIAPTLRNLEQKLGEQSQEDEEESKGKTGQYAFITILEEPVQNNLEGQQGGNGKKKVDKNEEVYIAIIAGAVVLLISIGAMIGFYKVKSKQYEVIRRKSITEEIRLDTEGDNIPSSR